MSIVRESQDTQKSRRFTLDILMTVTSGARWVTPSMRVFFSFRLVHVDVADTMLEAQRLRCEARLVVRSYTPRSDNDTTGRPNLLPLYA